MKSAAGFDIVMVCDFRLPGGVSSALASEIRTFSAAGLKIGLLQIDAAIPDCPATFHPEILRCVDFGSAQWLSSAQSVDCDLLALHEPYFFMRAELRRQNIRSRNRIMVAHSVPLGATGKLMYDPWRIDAVIRKNFGGEFVWAPISPVCRGQFCKLPFDLPLLADDWHNIIRAEDWGFPRSSPKFRNCVIGRHSRPGSEKWPTTRRELLQCYPPDSDFEVRILGANSYLRKLMGLVPENWRLFVYNEIPPKEFLQTIDFFVYFHHPLLVESFGRAPAEAAAAGCVLILPSYLRETFGDGAVYCQPQDVAATVRAYQSDPGAYGRQSRSGYDTVRAYYSPESLLRLAKATMDAPRIAVDRNPGFYSRAKNASTRLALRAELRIREDFPNPRQLARRILRRAARQLPGGMREWVRRSRPWRR